MTNWVSLLIIMKEIIRKFRFKIIFILIQIAIGVFIFIPGSNFLFYYQKFNNEIAEKELDSIYLLRIFDEQLNNLYFEKNIFNQISVIPGVESSLALYAVTEFEKQEGSLYTDLKKIIPGELFQNVTIYYTNSEYASFFNRKFLSGHYFRNTDDPDQIVISENTARLLFASVNCVGKKIAFTDYGEMEIQGVIKDDVSKWLVPGKALDFYFPYNKFRNDPGIDSILIKSKLPAITERLKSFFNENNQNVKIRVYYKYVIEEFNKLRNTAVIIITFSLILLLIAFTGNLGISLAFFINTIQVSGIKIAIGATRRHIYFQIVFENLLIYLLGALIGLIFSYAFKVYLNTIYSFYASLEFEIFTFIFVLAISLLLVSVISFIIIRKIRLYNPIDLLKHNFAEQSWKNSRNG